MTEGMQAFAKKYKCVDAPRADVGAIIEGIRAEG